MINVKNLVLGVGIVIVFALVLWQGIEAFYPTPEYSDFCDESKRAELIEDRVSCDEIGGQWNVYDGVKPRPINGEVVAEGWCDRDHSCRMDYDDSRDAHSKVVFYVALIVGLIVLFVGYTYLSVEPVGSALIGSGIWAIFFGSVVNWRNFSSIWRFLLLLAALIFLVWITLNLNSPNKKKGFFSKLLGK
jgi:hypothetical protein